MHELFLSDTENSGAIRRTAGQVRQLNKGIQRMRKRTEPSRLDYSKMAKNTVDFVSTLLGHEQGIK